MFRRLWVMVLAALCLCSCSADNIRTEKSVKEYETDFSAVKAEIIQLSGLNDIEFERSLNEEIEKKVEGDLIAFDSEAAKSNDKVRMGNKCVFEITWDEKYNKNDFLSIVEERYVYTGGAHGNTVRIPMNIDLQSQKQIKLADLFAEDGYENTLGRMINDIMQKQSEEYKDLWEKPEIKAENQTDFYIHDNKLVIFYQPYDLSYYARGFVEFELPLEELSGYMKEEYKKLAVKRATMLRQ